MRYWAACGRPGTDTIFDVNQMKVGRRLAMKVLNASKFVLSAAAAAVMSRRVRSRGRWTGRCCEIWRRSSVRPPRRSTAYDYARALQRTETFFWRFCDDYLELVKGRRYGDQGPEAAGSANAALATALSVLLRLFAPFLPFVTEEVWSWWQTGSIHQAKWPAADEIDGCHDGRRHGAPAADQAAYKWATEVVLFEVRKRRSEDKQPLKVPITRVTIKADPASISHMKDVEADLKSALRVQAFECTAVETGAPHEIVVTGYEPLAT